MRDYKGTMFSRHSRVVTHMNSQQLRENAQNLHRLRPDRNPSIKSKDGHKVLLLPKELLAADRD